MEPHAASAAGLPDFLRPPVDEVAASFQFPGIPGFGIQHFGLFWERVRKEYSRFETHPPIANVVERMEPDFGRHPEFAFVTVPDVRGWYLNASGDRLTQVQHNRFIHNWRKVTGDEPYPRYPAIRSQLAMDWSLFLAFLRDENLDPPKVNQCEVVYVNHIEYDKGWSGYGELGKVVATLATPRAKNRFLPLPERVNMQVSYRLEGNAGRLYVEFLPVIRARDGKEVLQMTLTARGTPKSGSDDDIFTWLDLGRSWVVRGFADFTTTTMHEIWGKK